MGKRYVRRKYRRRYRPMRKIRKLGTTIRRVVNRMSELKQVAIGYTGTANVPPLETYRFITNLPQGPGDNQRIGNIIRARYFSLRMQFIWFPVSGEGENRFTVRIRIVWPRKIGTVEALPLITTTNFPLHGLYDQDTWVLWKEWYFTIGDGQNYGQPRNIFIKFAKYFPAKLDFGRSTANEPYKQPLLIISHDADEIQEALRVTGYMKMSYRDL